MPGNIRVAVLEAVDLPSTFTAAAGKSVAVKVAVGKREFHTNPAEAQDGRTRPWNSEFLFPVLNLRDNLLVAITDSKGEVVGKAELETPGIVQKGFQDAFIALKAAGRIHVKVSFVLSEEERKKIEAMRAAALKKRKGFSNHTAKSRQAPISSVKITEIASEEPVELSKSTTKPGLVKEPEECPVAQAAELVTPEKVTVASKPEDPSPKRKGFSWFSGKFHESKRQGAAHIEAHRTEAAAEGSRWLEGLKLKSKNEKMRAARANEWMKSLDSKAQEQGKAVTSARVTNKSQSELQPRQNCEEKTVKQRLEDWRAKESSPWRRYTSKVRHASSENKRNRWTLCNRKPSIDEENPPVEREKLHTEVGLGADLMAAADQMWASTLHQESEFSGSLKQDKKSSGGIKAAVKQVLSGAAAVAGAFALWPRKGSSKQQERYHIVKEGETLSHILRENPGPDFLQLNPEVRDSNLIYPGQRLRLP